ncbi:MAG: hypothetical protein J7L47_08850 [Candidatus Odinarchaeota archaeon]|nr:hypothetical protein [Candidatus Odinarchaeota archaeon]
MSSNELEEIVEKIIQDTGMTRKEVFDYIKKVKEDFGEELISDVGAAHIVARDLGVNVFVSQPIIDELKISDLAEGDQNVIISGRVIRIFKVSTFNRKNGSVGKVGSFILRDTTGEIRVVLWDKNAELIERRDIKIGDIVKIINGYVRKGQNGIELHIGGYGQVQVNPPDVDKNTIPEIETRNVKIGEINERMYGISVIGKILSKSELSEYSKKDGSTGRRSRIILGDETGEISAVFWDDANDILEDAMEGDVIKLKNVRVKEGLGGRFEIHVDSLNNVESVDNAEILKDVHLQKGEEKKIQDIKGNELSLNVTARVIDPPTIKIFSRRDGTIGKRYTFVIADETAAIRVIAWGDTSGIEDLTIGDIIKIENAIAERDIYNNIQIRITGSTKLSKISDNKILPSVEKLPSLVSKKEPRFIRIAEIDSQSYVSIKGTIVKVFDKNIIYRACKKCFSKVDKINDKWICPNCGEIDSPVYRQIINVILDDGSESIRVTFIGDNAEELSNVTNETITEDLKNGYTITEISRKIVLKLIGMEIGVSGKVRVNSFTGNKEILVNVIHKIDPEKEVKNMIAKIKKEVKSGERHG